MGNLDVNPQVVATQMGHIRNASDEADQSATYIDFRASAQTTAKWGEEHGPGAFMSRYTTELDASKVEVMKLKAGLEQFVSTMDTLVKGFKGTDQAAAQNFSNAVTAATRRQTGTPDGSLAREIDESALAALGGFGIPFVAGKYGAQSPRAAKNR